MAAAASNKTKKKDLRYPELEEQALQYILDSCESSISKYSKFLQVTYVYCYSWHSFCAEKLKTSVGNLDSDGMQLVYKWI